MRSALIAGVAALLLAGCAGQPASQAPAAADAKATPAPVQSAAADNTVICTSEARTGSHLKSRLCTTAEQRARRRENDQKSLSDVQRRPGPAGGQ